MNKYIILGHENPDVDSIISGYLLEKLLIKLGYKAKFIIPDKNIEENTIKLCTYCNLDPKNYQHQLPKDTTYKYILVDHNERKLEKEIVAIIDHHPTENITTCPYYKNTQSSSTSLLIVINNEQYFSKEDIFLAIFAAMVDTAAFQSNKTVQEDIIWIKKQCQKYNFNYKEMLENSICETDLTNIKEASLNGLKTHTLANKKVASSYIELKNPEENQEKINEILNYLQTYQTENNYDLFAFIVHNITDFKTTLYKISQTTTKIVTYDEYTSRGTRIIPELTKELKHIPKKENN